MSNYNQPDKPSLNIDLFETLEILDVSLLSICKDMTNNSAKYLGWMLREYCVTQNPTFGQVFRQDFFLKSQKVDTKFLNRIVIWRNPIDGIIASITAIGQTYPAIVPMSVKQ